MKRLSIWVAFLLLWGEATAVEVNTSRWVPRTPKKPTFVVELPPLTDLEDEDVPLPLEEEKTPTKLDFNPSYRIITADDISRRKSRDVAEALTSLGLQVITSGGKGTQTSLIYKGYSGFDIKVYVDGVLVNSTTTGEFDWNSLDIAAIESITIVEIPAGQTEFAGCIIYIRTKGGTASILASVSSSSFISSERQSWNDGLENKFSIADRVGSHFYSVASSLSYDRNEYFRNVSTPVNWDNFDKLFNVQGKYQYTGPKTTTEVITQYTDNYLKAYSTGPMLSNGIQQDNILSLQVKESLNLTEAYSLEAIGHVRSDMMTYSLNNSRLTGDYEQTHTFLADTTVNLQGPISASVSYRNRQLLNSPHYRNEFGTSVSWGTSWSKLGLNLGSSLLCYFGENSGIQPLPYITLFGSFWSISAYRQFILPTFNQLYWGDYGYAKGNPDLKPESGVGTSLRFGTPDFPAWVNFTGSYYHSKICWVYEGWRMTPVNTSYTWLFACQVGYDSYLPFTSWTKSHLKASFDCTYTRSWLQGDFRQIMWVPEWKAHLGLDLVYHRWSLAADVNYMGARYMSNINYAEYPAYLLVNAALTVQPVSGLSFFLKCNNLLDVRVVHHDGYFIPSRSVTLGLQFTR